jgi:hypothetical protein
MVQWRININKNECIQIPKIFPNRYSILKTGLDKYNVISPLSLSYEIIFIESKIVKRIDPYAMIWKATFDICHATETLSTSFPFAI